MMAAAVLWFGLLGIGYVGGRVYGRYTLRRTDDGRSRGTYRLLAVVGLASLTVLAFAGLIDTTENALSSVHPALGSRFAAPLVWLPTAVGTIVAVLVTYLGVFPYARERRGLEITVSTAVGRLAKYLVAIAIFVLAGLGLFTALVRTSDPSPVLIPVVFVVLVVGVYVWLQYSVRLSQTVIEPTTEQRRAFEAAAGRVDLTATVAGVLPGHETEVAVIYLDGPFWNRRAYVTDYALEALDDDALTAFCARAKAADELRLLERRAVVAAVLFGLFLTVTVWTSIVLALVGLAIAGPLLTRHLRRCEFAADRHAARAVNTDDLVTAIDTGTDVTDGRGWLTERFAARPSRSRRLERLRNP